ncbi:MAG: hypothetical protein PHV28_06700 [Kiritimatiellae bacterium]|nr:hypothetical protein [Kiritimatiellia bacterium]
MKNKVLIFSFLAVVTTASAVIAAEPMWIESQTKPTNEVSRCPVEIGLFLNILDGSKILLESKSKNIDFYLLRFRQPLRADAS